MQISAVKLGEKNLGLRRYLRVPIQQLKLSEAATQRLEDKVERLSSNFQALDEKMNALLSTLPIAGGGSQKLIYQILNDERLKDLTLHARYLGNDINLRLNDSDINVYQQIFMITSIIACICLIARRK